MSFMCFDFIQGETWHLEKKRGDGQTVDMYYAEHQFKKGWELLGVMDTGIER